MSDFSSDSRQLSLQAAFRPSMFAAISRTIHWFFTKSSSDGRFDASRDSMLCTIPTCVHKNAIGPLLSVVTHATQILARCDVTRRAKLEAPTTSTKAQSDTDVIHRTGRSHELSSPYAPGCITLPRKRHFGIGYNTPRAVLPDL
eukprot:1195310-Prorocentrum_minimum.AAC.1